MLCIVLHFFMKNEFKDKNPSIFSILRRQKLRKIWYFISARECTQCNVFTEISVLQIRKSYIIIKYD